jgi:Phosphoadenosine phosphosulfate reductase family
MLSSMVNGRAITSHVLFAMSILSARFFSFALIKSRTLWSTNKKAFNAATVTTLRGGASSEAPINVEKADQKFHLDALALYEKLRSCNDGYIAAPVNSALDILMDALRLYGPKQLFASYNGGKDAVVVLHLLRAATAKYSQDIGKVCKPKLIYFAIDDEFPEVVDHINDSEKMYELDLERCEVGIMKVRCSYPLPASH